MPLVPASAVAGAGSSPAAEARAAASKRCARLAAELVKRTRHYPGESLPGPGNAASTPVCFDFTGDGRDDVAFGILSGGTAGPTYWAVYRGVRTTSRRLSRRYRKVAERFSGSHTRLLRSRRLLAVQTPIYRRDDANCCPSGGASRALYRVRRSGVVRVGSRTLTPREAGQLPTLRG